MANQRRTLAKNIEGNAFLRWTEEQQDRSRSFAFVIAIGMCVFLSVLFVVSGYAGAGQNGKIQVEDKINPNDAPLGSLIRLPGIGMGRAEAIITYRQAKEKEGVQAFQNTDDLQKVKGIGPKTAENISGWLKFE